MWQQHQPWQETLQLTGGGPRVCVCVFRLREAVRKMEEKHFADQTEEHVEFLPVEWRSKLALDGGKTMNPRVCLRSQLLLSHTRCPFTFSSQAHTVLYDGKRI